MEYVKENTAFLRYPSRYYQSFLFDPAEVPNKAKVIATYDKVAVDDDDLTILDFLYRTTFATKRQISRYCGGAGIEYIDERLNMLFKYHFINKFALIDEKKYRGQHPADAEEIYCLAEGGHLLLSVYTDDMIVWDFSCCIGGSKVVAKGLTDTELWLDVYYNSKFPIANYEKYPHYYINHKVFKTGSHYRIELNKEKNQYAYMLVETYLKDDDILAIRKRLNQLSSLLTTNIWRRYYPDTNQTPMLLIVVENDASAEIIAQELTKTNLLSDKAFRLTTNERLLGGITSSKAFLRYDKEKQTMYETSMEIFR